MITTVASNIPYSQRKREAVAQAVPHLAVGAADAYVATAVLKGLGGAQAAGTFSVISGGLAVVHGGRGIWNLMMASDQENKSQVEKKRFQTMALGEFITGVGFAGMAFGLGLWALPVVALGEVTTNFARFT